jgi:TolB-like protein
MGNSRISGDPKNPFIDKIFSNSDNKYANLGLNLSSKDILHSWKEISLYLDRDVRTCHRWEDELGLPVHRIDENSSRSKVFAYCKEIDQWLKEKAHQNKCEKTLSIWTNRGLRAGLAMGFSLLAVFFVWFYFFKSSAVSSISEPTLTVLPLKNPESAEHEEYFSEGITNEIVKSLKKLNKIKVIPDSGENLKFAEQKLKPDYLMMGELNHGTEMIHLSISLIRTEDNKNLWDGFFECDKKDICDLSMNISHKIHELLNIKVDETLFDQLKNGSTDDFAAYDTFLKGNFILNRISKQNDDPWKLYHQGKYLLGRWTQESNDMAISFFEQAIAIDSNYALAYIGLAQCYAQYVNFWWDSSIEWLNTAEILLEKAQQISPGLPQYYTALIKIYLLKEDVLNEDTSEFVFNLAKEATDKYPNYPQLNSITGYCYMAKFGESGHKEDFEKALEYNEKSFLLNQSSLNNIKYAELLMLKGEFFKAIEVCHLIERSDPSLFSKFMLGEIYYYMGRMEESEEIFRQFNVPLNFKIHSMYFLAMIEAQRGNAEQAKSIIKEAEFIKPEEYRDLPFHLEMASVFFGIGDEESGYKYLKLLFNNGKAKKDKYVNEKFTEIDKNFNKYRDKEKFQNLIRGDH